MISLDQVHLLEQKVESAVAKIAQLNAENAALRSKCAELTNALSAKSEQFSSFQQDQNKIEEGILKALNRLNTVESSLLGDASHGSDAVRTAPAAQTIKTETASEAKAAETVSVSNAGTAQVSHTETQSSAQQTSSPAQASALQTAPQSVPASQAAHSSQASAQTAASSASNPAHTAGTSSNQGQFDIF